MTLLGIEKRVLWCLSTFAPVYDCDTQVSKGTEPVEQCPAETCSLIQAQQYQPVSSTVPQLPLSVSALSEPLSRWLSSKQSDRRRAKGNQEQMSHDSCHSSCLLFSLPLSFHSKAERKRQKSLWEASWKISGTKRTALVLTFLFIYKAVFFTFIFPPVITFPRCVETFWKAVLVVNVKGKKCWCFEVFGLMSFGWDRGPDSL